MAFLAELGGNIEQPETCWDVMAKHKLARAVIILLGLYTASRLVTVILDVQRFAFEDVINAAMPPYFFTSIDRGSLWQSVIIGSFGPLVILAVSIVTAIITGWKTNHITSTFWEMLAATTVRLPIFFGVALVAVYFFPRVMIYQVTLMLVIWATCFGLGLLEILRVAGKVAARHEARPRAGIVPTLLVIVLIVTISIAITWSIGGFD
ncbi:MAG TPA: hypothetical protein VKM55_26315 [Candidatus Lokiarchaeia archaeon]|nr:hypothetical protein [Candidatus Lokiarchaeia archaeon]